MENLEQSLLELLADWLDSETVLIEETTHGFKDPVERSKSELHWRMRNAAMKEYKKTVTQSPPNK